MWGPATQQFRSNLNTQGQAAKALKILRPLKNKNLGKATRETLDCLCARLDRLNGDAPRALADLQSMIEETPLKASLTVVEATEMIGSLQNGKAPGPDAIPNCFLKRLSKNALLVIQKVFNQSSPRLFLLI